MPTEGRKTYARVIWWIIGKWSFVENNIEGEIFHAKMVIFSLTVIRELA